MVGEARTDEVTAYLARLLGHPVAADQTLQLRSVHRAAFVSWIRNQKLPVSLASITSGAPFTARQLLSGDQAAPSTPTVTRPTPATAPPLDIRGVSFTGIGIDIEDVQALPEADDYREHPFFIDTFTPSEMSYCVRQADVQASFCGTWAAKEAVVKSGRMPAPADRLNTVEIGRDARDRPTFSGCHLSISHTATTAVAVCIALSEPSTSALGITAAPADTAASSPLSPVRVDRKAQFRAAAAFAAIVLGGSVLSLALHAWP